ncbi:MAG TPA: MBL fold metallo-hydrolase [Nevskiaceae bacterium]|nr:MBL fold metallo-hydrolase [Nevskiaceae bacterium]
MKRLLACLALVLPLNDHAAPPTTPDVFSIDMTEVAPGVLAYVEQPPVGIVSGTIVAVIGQKSVMIFDTGHHPTVTRLVAKDLRKRTQLPVRFVVNSHWHDDHWVGNAAIADLWPGVSVIAHRFTAAMMEQRKDKFSGAPCVAELTKQSKTAREELATGQKADGTPLSAMRRMLDEKLVAEGDYQIRECDRMAYRGADVTFEDAMELHLGDRDVWLLHLGRGNTAGDVVALIPDAKVLLTGDLLVHPWPFATESYIGEWAQVLRRLEALDTAAIVPGHGAVQRDKTYLRLVAELMESIASQVHAAYKPDMTLEELEPLVKLDEFRTRFAGDDKFLQANFDYMVGQLALKRAWQQAAGKLEPEGQPLGP